ncbi:hypothetical protein MF672_008685 [Actinomadura sp. ATCC 31491]|uniref:WD40 repeat domain-containing protein n=1 Tax=Actinomadura luzonensis TaxID=2805427 RepID=A0ABT0FND9_9ACTN|nr:hypothetical protein [Actinomadura luzonensis]MCK2213865.1 hypothetical protein [Actinomadura luzonensis]
MTRLLRDTMEEWAGEARVPHDLADRALRGRVRRPAGPPVLLAGLAAGLVAVLIAGVTFVLSGQRQPAVTVRPATGITLPARPSPAPTDVRADVEHSPPARLVAAGRLAMSAYYTTSEEPAGPNLTRYVRTWSLYDPRTGGYERTSWGWLDVAPGLQVAAVLERDLPARRIGVLDLNTRRILAWFDVEHPVAGLSWSPDGRKVLATAYSGFPDTRGRDPRTRNETLPPSTRTGYYVVDVEAGTADYHELPARTSGDEPANMNGRQDLGWSLDGTAIWAPTDTQPDRVWYTLDGAPREAPQGQVYVGYSAESALSPDGRLVLGPDGLPTEITDRATGAVAGRQRVLQLHAWADDDNVLALGCAGSCGDEFDNGLVLVSVDGERMTQLAANRDSNRDGAWRWILTPR